jgi:hypothetical protein
MMQIMKQYAEEFKENVIARMLPIHLFDQSGYGHLRGF